MTEELARGRQPAPDSPALPPGVSAAIIALLVGFVLFLMPRPAGVSIEGWRMFAIFLGTILALVLRPVPGGAA